MKHFLKYNRIAAAVGLCLLVVLSVLISTYAHVGSYAAAARSAYTASDSSGSAAGDAGALLVGAQNLAALTGNTVLAEAVTDWKPFADDPIGAGNRLNTLLSAAVSAYNACRNGSPEKTAEARGYIRAIYDAFVSLGERKDYAAAAKTYNNALKALLVGLLCPDREAAAVFTDLKAQYGSAYEAILAEEEPTEVPSGSDDLLSGLGGAVSSFLRRLGRMGNGIGWFGIFLLVLFLAVLVFVVYGAATLLKIIGQSILNAGTDSHGRPIRSHTPSSGGMTVGGSDENRNPYSSTERRSFRDPSPKQENRERENKNPYSGGGNRQEPR